MPFRVITRTIHAYLIDYPTALLLIIAPFVLNLGAGNPVAIRGSSGARLCRQSLQAGGGASLSGPERSLGGPNLDRRR